MDIDWKDLDGLWSIELGQDQGTLVVVFVRARPKLLITESLEVVLRTNSLERGQ